jgi:hypothetical protein
MLYTLHWRMLAQILIVRILDVHYSLTASISNQQQIVPACRIIREGNLVKRYSVIDIIVIRIKKGTVWYVGNGKTMQTLFTSIQGVGCAWYG